MNSLSQTQPSPAVAHMTDRNTGSHFRACPPKPSHKGSKTMGTHSRMNECSILACATTHFTTHTAVLLLELCPLQSQTQPEDSTLVLRCEHRNELPKTKKITERTAQKASKTLYSFDNDRSYARCL